MILRRGCCCISVLRLNSFWLQTLLELLAAGSHDKDTLMAARIAEFLFPASQHRSQDEAYSAYAARVKLMYHKQVLVPLRACLDVPEVTCN